MRHNFVY